MTVIANDAKYAIWLSHLAGFGNQKIKQLLSEFGSARAIFDLKVDEIERIPYLNDKLKAVLRNKNLDYANGVLEDCVKKEHFALVQTLAGRFREEVGSIICRELLDNPPSDPTPSPRTAEYYAARPCARMVMTAARILDEYIAEHPIAP